MRKLVLTITLSMFVCGKAQQVRLSKAESVGPEGSTAFYKLDSLQKEYKYLGELEIWGATEDEAMLFNKVLDKSKQIGANAYLWQPIESLEGVTTFNPNHFYLSLYYVQSYKKEENVVYLISSSSEKQRVTVNGTKTNLPPKSFRRFVLSPGETMDIASGGFLGSKINLGYKENQPVQFLRILKGGISVNHGAPEGGLKIKSGDLQILENRFGYFLTQLYSIDNHSIQQ